MKKLAVVILSLCAVMLSGCSKKEITVDPTELANSLLEQVKFVDSMTKLDKEAVAKLYGIKGELLESQAVYISTGATAEEIAILKATDEKNADTLYQALETRIEDQKTAFEDYVPAEMKKLEDPILIKKGNYVICCISNDNESANDVITREIEKKN